MNPETLTDLLMRPNGPNAAPAPDVEAARYALSRRLWPALRHQMVRHLQPIGMIYGVVDHRLASGQPDVPELHRQMGKINQLAKSALGECVASGSWLCPEPLALTTVGEGLADCVSLLATSLMFRGFQLRVVTADAADAAHVEAAATTVRQDAFRGVVAAAIVAATDVSTGPADVLLSASVEGAQVTVTLMIRPLRDGETQPWDDGYRKLLWPDVQAIARDDRVALRLDGNAVCMGFAVEKILAAH